MMLSFHGQREVKEFYLKRARGHHEADEIVKGKYWENGKGCAVGCLIHSGDHERFPELLGWPEWLARLIDTLFENLPNELAKEWPVQVVDAVPVGADLAPVKWRFCSFLMQENLDRVESLQLSDELKTKVKDAIRLCQTLHDDAVVSGLWDDAAESAAWSAAESARSAARSAESAAESAESAYIEYADKLLKLLRGAV
jgi:hypothetical protein